MKRIIAVDPASGSDYSVVVSFEQTEEGVMVCSIAKVRHISRQRIGELLKKAGLSGREL